MSGATIRALQASRIAPNLLDAATATEAAAEAAAAAEAIKIEMEIDKGIKNHR